MELWCVYVSLTHCLVSEGSPRFRVYHVDKVFDELEQATRSYLQSTVSIDKTNKMVGKLPRSVCAHALFALTLFCFISLSPYRCVCLSLSHAHTHPHTHALLFPILTSFSFRLHSLKLLVSNGSPLISHESKRNFFVQSLPISLTLNGRIFSLSSPPLLLLLLLAPRK